MECYHCGQDNDDEAIYCKHCGQRVDGKVECPSCNKLVDSDSQFCGYCGHDLQEQEECMSNDEVVFHESAQYDKCQSSSAIFSLATTFFSLIFTFFIGINSSAFSMVTATNSNTNLFYFFKDVYKYLDTLKDSELTDMVISTNYFYAVVGTLLAIAIILTVCIFFILTIVKFITGIKGKSKESYYSFALSTYLAYIVGVALFYAFDSANAQTNYYNTNSQLNFYTVIGVILSTTCMAIATVSNVIRSGNLFSRQKTKNLCFTALGLILLAVLTVLVASPSIALKNDKQAMNISPFFALLYLATSYASKEPAIDPITNLTITPTKPSGIYSMIVFEYLIGIIMIVMLIAIIAMTLKNASIERRSSNRKHLIISIALSVISIIYLIVGNVANNLLVDYASESQNIELSTSVVPFVIIVIISLAYTVMAICSIVCSRNKNCEE